VPLATPLVRVCQGSLRKDPRPANSPAF